MAREKLPIYRYEIDQNGKVVPVYIGEFDPLNLPYGEFNQDHPLIIDGDVDLRKYRPQKNDNIPSFKHVFVRGNFYCSKHVKIFPDMVAHGVFDCSNCGKNYIDKDTQLPLAMSEMNCEYSITGLDVLFGKLPKQLKKIIIEKNLISKENLLENPEKLEIARRFFVMYPNIIVTDKSNKFVLSSVLHDIDSPKVEVIEPIKKEIKVEVENVPIKTDSDIDINDIILFVNKHEEFDKFNLGDDEIKRFIKIVLSDSRANGVKKYQKMRQDGEIVSCVDKSAWPKIHQDLLKLIQDSRKVKEEKKKKTQDKPKEETPKTESIEITKPIVIEKYISSKDLKDIRRLSGQRGADSVLAAINEINLDPMSIINYEGPVQILKDGKVVVSSTIRKRKGATLVQSIDSNTTTDRKRVVWTVGYGPDNEIIIVCVGVVGKHSETIKEYNKYKPLMESSRERQVFTKQELDEYLKVSELLSVDEKFKQIKVNTKSITR